VQHPSYLLNPSVKPSDTLFDIGIITLSEPVSGITPTTVLSTGPTTGQAVEIIGFGVTRANTEFGPPFILNAGVTTYQQVTLSNAFWEFKAGQSNTGEGDSGGPAFVVTPDGSRYLSTITQGGDEPSTQFGTASWNARIDTQIPWMEIVTGMQLSTIDSLT